MSEVRALSAETPGILSFRGPDAVRYLNGQLTQSTADLGDESRPSCVTDAKGRLQFMVHVLAGPNPEELWITCQPDQVAGLRDRLERYLIADDVEVSDLTGSWTRIHADSVIDGAAFRRASRGVFGDGLDQWWHGGEAPAVQEIDSDVVENLRVEAGIPAWGKELSEGMLPPEAGLDRTAISYAKGCYIGQEVLSRVKSAGKLNRRLARLRLDASVPAETALSLDETEIGTITSVAPHPSSDGTVAALGWIRKAGFDRDAFGVPGGLTARFVGWA
ncbi:glycine cleavage system T protein, aminomethyl transferase [Haloferula helveola]|uniref:Glycine cleavage system T protein, aminomethyl transferase n=1 Tax=Haloferula helveola TaxID=490095 RepID=A0ABM7RGS2_9BACT|nr:glycine cleavage system T protein, aminomethyl transferase [Haloferula helveola]